MRIARKLGGVAALVAVVFSLTAICPCLPATTHHTGQTAADEHACCASGGSPILTAAADSCCSDGALTDHTAATPSAGLSLSADTGFVAAVTWGPSALSAPQPSVVGAESASPAASGLGPELHVQTGLSTASPHVSGATAGGSVILHQGRRLAFEGSGAYLKRGEGASALSLSAGVILNLLSTEEKAVPYMVGGGGLLRASFDTRNPRFSGAARSGEMGAGRYRHVMDGAPPGWDLGELPPFYGDRLQTLIARDGRTGRASFSDPALTFGTGVRVRLGRRWLAGQDARALLILRSGSVYTLWAVTIHLGRAF